MLAMLEGIEDLLKRVSDSGDGSRALVTFASAVGVLVIVYYLLSLTYQWIKLVRLYVFHQCCCQVDFVTKYGQWAVVSGATDGIGQSLAKELARRGMSIIVVARSDEKLAKTKEMLERQPNVGQIETVKIDMSDASIKNYDRIRAQIDPDNRDIGVLINNAGSVPGRYVRFNRFELEEIVSQGNLNALGVVHLTRMIMPGMVARGRGLIVNNSSIVGKIPAPHFNLYAPTKSFVNAFTRQLQLEYGDHPIDIVLLRPGPVSTKLLKSTSVATGPSFLIPKSDDYAKTTLNAISMVPRELTGNIWHQFMMNFAGLLVQLNAIPVTMKCVAYMKCFDKNLSPVPKRKRVVVVPNQVASSKGDDLLGVTLS